MGRLERCLPFGGATRAVFNDCIRKTQGGGWKSEIQLNDFTPLAVLLSKRFLWLNYL